MFCFSMVMGVITYANEIDYSNCESIQNVIDRETQEIASTNPADHTELAELYVSRGESYLLDAQYEMAAEDFHNANVQLGYTNNISASMIVAFRTAFGEAVCYDNLGMPEHTQQAIQQLLTIANHAICDDCAEHRPCHGMIIPSANKLPFRDLTKPAMNRTRPRSMALLCKNKNNQGNQQRGQNGFGYILSSDNYSDILGPDVPPDSAWCEEVVVGVGRAMDAIACLAPSPMVRVVLIGVIEALITRGVKCCEAGGFWKACVAPIARKWKEWKDNKENGIFPNEFNLPRFMS
jgi:hypothetical protein